MAKKNTSSERVIDVAENVEHYLRSEIFFGNESIIIPGSPDMNRVSAKGASASGSGAEAARKEKQLNEFMLEIKDCTKCVLHAERDKFVFGEGSANADLMFIGEAPGRDENMQGRPFVGRAGKLLTKMINALGMERGDVYIANICKCWPPGNRPPAPEEANTCMPYLARQIEIIAPKVIVALGATATRFFLQDSSPIGQLRGKRIERDGLLVIPTYHPAYLLRSPSEKKKVWEDVRGIPGLLKEL